MRQRGKRGKGTVYQDVAAGCWVAQVSLGVRDGKRIRRKVRAASEDEARVELERLRRAYSAGADPAKGTLDHYLADWLASHRHVVRASTMTSYRGHVELHISPLLGGISVARLRPSDVRRLIEDRLAAGLSPATVGRIITTLRIALNQGVRDRTLLDNAANGVSLPRVHREPIEAMTAATAQHILDAVRGDHLEALYVLLLGSGMRVGEACALDWRDVDLDSGSVFIREGKTRAARRTIPLPAFVVAALRAHRASAKRVGPAEPVFLGERSSERLRVDSASHQFPALLQAQGLPRLTVHQLRHATATLLLQRGVPMRDIADILGHANPSMTANVYSHVSQDSKRLAMHTLDEIGEIQHERPDPAALAAEYAVAAVAFGASGQLHGPHGRRRGPGL